MHHFDTEQPRILVIDDDRQVLDEVAAILVKANFTCCLCTTPDEATSAVETASPDMILCDVNLQGESGLELCERIKQHPGLADVPVMLLSGFQLPDIIRRSRGVCSLRKPFDPDVLVELVDQAVSVPEMGYAFATASVSR